LDTVYETAIQKLGLTAYRTGGNYGVPVSQADQQSGDPSNYVILVDDGYTLDSTGAQNNIAYNSVLVGSDQPVNLQNQNFARITLDQLACPTGDNGYVCVTVSNPNSVRLYDSSGYELAQDDLIVPVHGSGYYLAGLATGNEDIYVEGLQANSDFTLTYGYVTSGGLSQSGVSIHMAIADVYAVDGAGNPLPLITAIGGTIPASGAPLGGLLAPFLAGSYRVRINGLSSGEIQNRQATVTSDQGGQYVDNLTDTPTGAVSAMLAVLLNNNGQALTPEQQAAILSSYGLNVLDPLDGITVTIQTGKDTLVAVLRATDTWEIHRSGQQWAQATGGRYDTINQLAKSIRLDSAEFTSWLKVTDNGGLPAAAGQMLGSVRTFSVPNTMVIAIGKLNAAAMIFAADAAMKIANAAQADGLNAVVYMEDVTPTSATVLNAFSDPDVWGYAFLGHGYLALTGGSASDGAFIWNQKGFWSPSWDMLTADNLATVRAHKFALAISTTALS
jgi:hypothetical protein